MQKVQSLSGIRLSGTNVGAKIMEIRKLIYGLEAIGVAHIETDEIGPEGYIPFFRARGI
jgi:hypothetical protein